MRSNYKQLGAYIKQVDVRNTNNRVTYLRGVSSVYKCLIQSKANTIGTDMSTYKLVSKNQFVFNPNTARMGDKIPIALNDSDDCIVSQIYPVFDIINNETLIPEYLMMWFKRPEFDRYARFYSHGSAREIFDWEQMCEVELPIPRIEKQREIVKEYNVLVDRINLNNQIIQKLEETAQAIYKQWFVDFEFLDEKGKPYKSNGGEMELNEELEKDIPKGWVVSSLKEFTTIIDNRGKTPPHTKIETSFPIIEIGAVMKSGRIINYEKCEKYVDEKTYLSWFRSGHPKKKDVLFSTVGSLAELKIFWGTKGSIAQNIVAFRCKEDNGGLYLYQVLTNSRNEIISYEIGSVQASIKVSQVVNFKILLPSNKILNDFEKKVEIITDNLFELSQQNLVLNKIIQILLQRITNL